MRCVTANKNHPTNFKCCHWHSSCVNLKRELSGIVLAKTLNLQTSGHQTQSLLSAQSVEVKTLPLNVPFQTFISFLVLVYPQPKGHAAFTEALLSGLSHKALLRAHYSTLLTLDQEWYLSMPTASPPFLPMTTTVVLTFFFYRCDKNNL